MKIRLLLPLLLLSACSEEVELPAPPLTADVAELRQMYKWGRGPRAVSTASGLSLAHPHRDETLSFDVYYPAGDRGDLPVLLFSHGNFSTNGKYDALLSHWVSHGYVVVAPLHKDGSGGYWQATIDMLRYGIPGVIKARVDDLSALLDIVPQLAEWVPALQGRIDATRIAATGHSFGAFNAQQLGGARAFDADTGLWRSRLDARIAAVVAISPPGPMFEQITAQSWQQQAAPTLMSTGTGDVNAIFWPDWQLHRMSFDSAIAGHQYALVVQGADHYLGNLIGRPELAGPPQDAALAMVNTAVIAFLDAYLKRDAAALKFIRSGQMAALTERFAVVEKR